MGDIYPFLKLAVALIERGNRVTFLGSGPHADYVRKKGVPFHSIFSNEEFSQIISESDLWHPQKGARIVFEAISRRIDPILDFVAGLSADQALTFICHPLVLPCVALVGANRVGVLIVGAYLAPSSLRSYCDPMTLGVLRIPHWMPFFLRRWMWQLADKYYIDPFIVPALNEARKLKGLPPVSHFFEHMQSIPDLSVTFFPCWFSETRSDWPQPMYRVNFPLYDPNPVNHFSDELNLFLMAGDAPIIFTPGTGNRHATNYFKIALQASVLLGKRAIFLTKYPEQIPIDLPSTVIWQEYLPLHQLLPKAAVLVHHGGIGTVAEALRAGVPQLIIPLAFDQFDNAACVERLGAGVSLLHTSLSVDRLIKKLRELFSSDKVAAHCELAASRFADGDKMDSLCETIEAL